MRQRSDDVCDRRKRRTKTECLNTTWERETHNSERDRERIFAEYIYKEGLTTEIFTLYDDKNPIKENVKKIRERKWKRVKKKNKKRKR